tara:strand:+ start:170 stop:649 length:480 start_codon:yes stop_codon:yes gene_type:complete
MKEDILRTMIRKQIKSSLKEAAPRGQVATTLGRVEKMAGVKMLKKALGQGGPQQQAAGLLAVVRAISGDSPQVAKMLARMLTRKGIDDPGSEPAPDMQEAKSLDVRGDKLDKTQAMKMLQKSFATKPANQQAEFIANLVKKFNLKGNISMLIKKIRDVN